VTAPPDSDFAALGAPAPLAAALSAREYLTPTPVQARVLESPDQDLLVSAQTGSGKTVAFGLIIGKLLLGEAATLPPSGRPRALVIAPTRELAAQVQRELAWLFAPTGARCVAFTGGTDLRGDMRAMRGRVDLVVGTPGRLVDLVTRGALDLGGVEVVVLDEADEMLDMGFREELDAILTTTPVDRRTLMFSATLPPPIRSLAKKFQREAFDVDLRGGARTSAHADIRHVAYLCADGERLQALVNMLRLVDDQRVIVFCRTRDAVADLHAQLISRGFQATAISGDRAQEERTRALEALRRGHVRVLVATNVAARGLDLPEVGLVVHADLPENADALTHRSGRTGRAGNKGVNAFLVERGARRRAQRLFQTAQLQLAWTAPPDAPAVAAHDRARLRAEIVEALASAPPDAAALALAAELIADHDVVQVAALLLQRSLASLPTGEPLTKVDLHEARPASSRGPSGPSGPPGQMALFQINLGMKDKAEANWILPLVCRRGGITRREVGAIRVTRDHTVFEIDARVAAEFAVNAGERDPRAPQVRITPATELPERTFTPPRPHKGGFAKRGKPPRRT
jgi:ATP-dependent RNA helicase DeaD